MSDTADKIAKLLEDPESIKMISEIAESFMGSSEGKDSNKSSAELSEELFTKSVGINMPDKTDVVSDIPKEFGSIKLIEDLLGKGDVENSIKLITALLPYMSKRRRESADSVLKLLKALKLIRKSNISELSKLINLIQ